jgi:hypothetical protein
MSDIPWDTPYIHGTGQDVDNICQVTHFDSVFTVYVEQRENKFTPKNFLEACWKNGFDTTCTICKKPFDMATEPPVRLLSLGQNTHVIDPLTKSLPPLFVWNYHLRCLKANRIKFIPVSYPWQSSVAEAYALRTFNPTAAQICFEAPARKLLAVIRRFGPEYLLWHSYFSIPHWHGDYDSIVTFSKLLKIYETSGATIFHLGYHPPAEVVQTPSLGTISEHNNDLKRFFNAHLFTRLWPIIEYDRAGEAYIMNNEYRIMESKFSVFVNQILKALDATSTTLLREQMASS